MGESQPLGNAGACLPVVIVVDPGTAAIEVVGLPLLDRLLVTFHRAGASRLTVVAREDSLPALQRARALGISWDVVGEMPVVDGPVVVSGTSWWGTREEVARGMALGGRWVDAGGEGLGVGVLAGTSPDWEVRLARLEARRLGSSCLCVRDAAGGVSAAGRLWGGLSSSADGRVDRWFNRPVGRWLLSRWLVKTWVTPNQVSLLATAMGLAAGALFCVPGDGREVMAAILFQASAVVDCVDGDIARAVFKESRLGKWIDLVGDQVVHAAVFGGIAVGLGRGEAGNVAAWLGASAVLGALLSFGVVLRGMLGQGGMDGRLQRFIDGATNRDFSVLVLVLACVGRLEWFLWMAAVGGHVFWMVALGLQQGAARGGAGRGKGAH